MLPAQHNAMCLLYCNIYYAWVTWQYKSLEETWSVNKFSACITSCKPTTSSLKDWGKWKLESLKCIKAKRLITFSNYWRKPSADSTISGKLEADTAELNCNAQFMYSVPTLSFKRNNGHWMLQQHIQFHQVGCKFFTFCSYTVTHQTIAAHCIGLYQWAMYFRGMYHKMAVFLSRAQAKSYSLIWWSFSTIQSDLHCYCSKFILYLQNLCCTPSLVMLTSLYIAI